MNTNEMIAIHLDFSGSTPATPLKATMIQARTLRCSNGGMTTGIHLRFSSAKWNDISLGEPRQEGVNRGSRK
jgi:hypothetical protein